VAWVGGVGVCCGWWIVEVLGLLGGMRCGGGGGWAAGGWDVWIVGVGAGVSWWVWWWGLVVGQGVGGVGLEMCGGGEGVSGVCGGRRVRCSVGAK